MKTFTITTLGCRVNQSESESMAAALQADGWTDAAGHGAADLCIINTCTVTSRGARQSRQAIRRARRENPDAVVIVTGCHATVNAEEIEAMGVADFIVKNREKFTVCEIAGSLCEGSSEAMNRATDVTGVGSDWPAGCFTALRSSTARTRPVLKIQDGCNSYCTYCIVPFARGASVSMPVADVVKTVQAMSEAGRREVVFSGIHLGMYGADLSPRVSLLDLLREVYRQRIIQRVRLSSIEPHELGDDLIRFTSDTGWVCDHFHLPLQSGSDRILNLMNRPYTASFYAKRVYEIRKFLPHAAIGMDILVGFPGEGKREFGETLSLVRDLPVSYLHVFPFSPRRGTRAFKMEPKVPDSEIRERCALLREIGANKRHVFGMANHGRKLSVVVEESRDRATGLLKGMASNYLSVLLDGPDDLKGLLVDAIADGQHDGLRICGRVVGQDAV